MLFVVATPIGNLKDITLRALETLREATVIAAEDTRYTRQLLSAHAIVGKSLVSLHAHSTDEHVAKLVVRLAAGDTVALVTDAGTPGVSDPGDQLVRAAIAAGKLSRRWNISLAGCRRCGKPWLRRRLSRSCVVACLSKSKMPRHEIKFAVRLQTPTWPKARKCRRKLRSLATSTG